MTRRKAIVDSTVMVIQFVISNVLFNWTNVFNPALVSLCVRVAVIIVQTLFVRVLIPRKTLIITCVAWVETVYVDCLAGCPAGDVHCLSLCGRDYNNLMEQCPCQAGCSNGCPCEAYECAANMRLDSVLVLHNATQALITNADGDVTELVGWTIDGEASSKSLCSLTFKNQMYIYGSTNSYGSYHKQISSVTNCGLKRVGTLPFSLENGSCFSTNEHILLCFGLDDTQQCYRSSQPLNNFTKIAKSSFGHYQIRMAASKVFGFAVGHGSPTDSKGHAETELLRISDWTWSTRATYPYKKNIRLHAPVVHDEMLYVFGGYKSNKSGYLSTIAMYNANKNTWSKVGELKEGRARHQAIFIQGEFLVIDDNRGKVKAEKCYWTTGNSMMTCVEQEPNIETGYTNLFNVHASFCQ